MSSSPAGRFFALIPAAGRSRRMGTPKLLLRLGTETVIRGLVNALKSAGVDHVHVLVRADDVDLQSELRSLDCEIVRASSDPPEMRDSVELLIRHLTETVTPNSNDHWLLIPADHPFVEKETIQLLVDRSRLLPEQIILPTLRGRRGHPTLFPWSISREVSQIPHDKGLNWLVRRDDTRVTEVPVTRESVLFDLDTPEDLARAQDLARQLPQRG